MSPLRWTWVQKLLGIKRDQIPEDADLHLTWSNLPESWRVFAAAAAVGLLIYGVLWLYRQDAGRLPPRIRRLLAGLRVAVLLLLAALAMGPAVGFTHRQTLEPSIIVLRDASQSMATPDGYRTGEANGESGTRVDAVNRLLATTPASLVPKLQKRGRIRVVDFADSVTSVPLAEPTPTTGRSPAPVAIPPLKAEGAGTNLHRALTEALSERLSAGIVVLTDGQQTDRSSGKDELLALAARAVARGVPLLIVGLGDPNPPRNIRALDVFASDRVWKDDPFELQASLESEGLGGRKVQVDLVEQRRSDAGDQLGDEKVIDSKEIELPAAGGPTRLVFSHTSKEAGRFSYSLRVQPQDDESTATDNRSPAPAEVKVIDDKARILVISGTPNWDFRFLHRILEREKSIDVSCWLQTLGDGRAQEGDIAITKLPRSREELFAYDVIILIDPNPQDFDENWGTLLTEFVRDHSGGLLYMAGPAHTSQFLGSPRTEMIREILPVRFGDVAAVDIESLLQSEDRDWPLGVVPQTLDHPIMRFFPEINRSLDIWKLFPGILWSYPVREAIPTATVLLQHTDPAVNQVHGPRPLLVADNLARAEHCLPRSMVSGGGGRLAGMPSFTTASGSRQPDS